MLQPNNQGGSESLFPFSDAALTEGGQLNLTGEHGDSLFFELMFPHPGDGGDPTALDGLLVTQYRPNGDGSNTIIGQSAVYLTGHIEPSGAFEFSPAELLDTLLSIDLNTLHFPDRSDVPEEVARHDAKNSALAFQLVLSNCIRARERLSANEAK